MTRASILITVFNCAGYIEGCIAGALDQTFTDIEVVVVDDGSTDETAELIEKISDPRLKLFRVPHMGRAKALNFGLSKCSADYVAILDADDVCLPHRVEAEIAFLDDHPDVAMVGSAQRVIIDKDDQEIRLDVLPTSSDDLHATLAQGQNPFLHSSVMFRADLVRALGGYDESLSGFLDLNLYAALAARHKLANIPDRLALKRWHRGQYFGSKQGVLWTEQGRKDMEEVVRRAKALSASAPEPALPSTPQSADYAAPSDFLSRAAQCMSEGGFTEAAALFSKCLEACTDEEERWYARWQYARCLLKLGDEAGFTAAALSAYDARPDRAEPLYDLARYHRDRGAHAASCVFSEAGLALLAPAAGKFVDEHAYRVGLKEEYAISANYAKDPGRKARGFAACNWLALARDIPSGSRGLARWNLFFYIRPAAASMPSFTARPHQVDRLTGETADDQRRAPATGSASLSVIQSFDPLRVVDAAGFVLAETPPPIAAETFAACGPAVAYDDGWLVLVKESLQRFGKAQSTHRFAWLDTGFDLRRVSRPFWLHNNGFEAASGLEWDGDGRRLVLSYSTDNGRTWAATVEAREAAAMLDDAAKLPTGDLRDATTWPQQVEPVAYMDEPAPRLAHANPASESEAVAGQAPIDIGIHGGLGDVLMCTPALRALHAADPSRPIRFYSHYSDVVRGLPFVGETHPIASAPEGTIFAGYGPSNPPYAHIALTIGDCIGVEVSDVRPECMVDQTLVDSFRQAWSHLPRPIVIVSRHASGWTPNKNWPDANWVELIDAIAATATVVEIGWQAERAPAKASDNYIDLIGRTSLPEMIAAVAAADVNVGPVSAPLHIAAAVGRRSVVICGGYEHPSHTAYPGNIALYTPVACAPCWMRDPCPYDSVCLRAITPAKAFEALRTSWPGYPQT